MYNICHVHCILLGQFHEYAKFDETKAEVREYYDQVMQITGAKMREIHRMKVQKNQQLEQEVLKGQEQVKDLERIRDQQVGANT